MPFALFTKVRPTAAFGRRVLGFCARVISVRNKDVAENTEDCCDFPESFGPIVTEEPCVTPYVTSTRIEHINQVKKSDNDDATLQADTCRTLVGANHSIVSPSKDCSPAPRPSARKRVSALAPGPRSPPRPSSMRLRASLPPQWRYSGSKEAVLVRNAWRKDLASQAQPQSMPRKVVVKAKACPAKPPPADKVNIATSKRRAPSPRLVPLAQLVTKKNQSTPLISEFRTNMDKARAATDSSRFSSHVDENVRPVRRTARQPAKRR
ncbi:hypothetical protein PUNSTDRAFT_43246 [Punctularia strigosozonata HHB-11173 SS5]|uniref:uncharacterized protein n=1 Tax=Punctularia strigosozonata (strain HHB-11173) TaxID=741275 RepID=UPI00044175F7|nr:uncharacterized protein PUNSTDRAFT_43246 [Punctularia strigosozonata HHB-11173 SS5]EIN10277.1 hypothetical protein PUNSTDRAFT_43246 [Punctularia strigosozonata HHB-11173 SS5]